MSDRAGTWKNNLSGEAAYKSFVSSRLPPDPPVELSEKMVESPVKASKQLDLLREGT